MLTSLTETKNTANRKANRRAILVAIPLLFLLIGIWVNSFRTQYIKQLNHDTQQALTLIEQVLQQIEAVADKSLLLLNDPCEDVNQQLRTNALSFTGIRSINLFNDHKLYCSTLLTTINHKIATDRPLLALATKTSLSSDSPPLIQYIKRNNTQGVLITFAAEHIVTMLNLSKTIQNKENFQLVIGDQWYFNGQIGLNPHYDNVLFSASLTSQHYPFSISNGHTRAEFYQAFKNRSRDIFFLALLSIIIGGLIKKNHYQRLLKKSFTILSQAIKYQQVKPYVQPIVNARDGSWLGVEVLARWQDPNTQAFIAPEIFIPVAEHSELIIPLTSSFFLQVAEALVPIEHQLPQGFKVSFNVSARNCSDLTLLHDCIAFMQRFRHNKILLVLELTERDLIEMNDFTNELFAQLRTMNVEIVLDDFGTKYSNLAYFNKFNINYFKIDPSFTAKIETTPLTGILIDNMLDLATNLAMPIIVEGIETEAQRDYFLARGIDQQQGYLFAKPMALGDFTQYFSHQLIVQ